MYFREQAFSHWTELSNLQNQPLKTGMQIQNKSGTRLQIVVNGDKPIFYICRNFGDDYHIGTYVNGTCRSTTSAVIMLLMINDPDSASAIAEIVDAC